MRDKKIKYIHEKEVWLVYLELTKGIEVKKIRPCIVIRKFSETHFIVLATTSQDKTKYKFHFKIKNKEITKHKPSFVILSQIRTVDKIRFKRKLGELTSKEFVYLNKKAATILRLSPRRASAHNQSVDKSTSGD